VAELEQQRGRDVVDRRYRARKMEDVACHRR
jgi:hypothetical protein